MELMCGNLMKEMLWAQAPTTIKYYTYKKQLADEEKTEQSQKDSNKELENSQQKLLKTFGNNVYSSSSFNNRNLIT